MGFSRKEYWSGLPGPPSGDLPVGFVFISLIMSFDEQVFYILAKLNFFFICYLMFFGVISKYPLPIPNQEGLLLCFLPRILSF